MPDAYTKSRTSTFCGPFGKVGRQLSLRNRLRDFQLKLIATWATEMRDRPIRKTFWNPGVLAGDVKHLGNLVGIYALPLHPAAKTRIIELAPRDGPNAI